MKFAFPQYFDGKSRFLTYHVVYSALKNAGHEISQQFDDCDAVLFSMRDVTEYPELVKLKKSTNLPVIVGGHYAFNYWSAILYSDYVWIGDIWDFADCKTLGDLELSKFCYTGKQKQLFSSQRIEYSQIPLCQIAPKKVYYLGGVGCKNACKFCFTSWTHEHSTNSPVRVQKAKEMAAKKKMHLTIVSNEYENSELGGTTLDMLLVDYIKRPVKALMVRCGIEFATEETRAYMGKKISNNDIYKAIQKMNIDNITLRLFHITGYDSIDDWKNYIKMIGSMLSEFPNNRLLHLAFNNLQYQNYTPLYRERYSINPEKYIDFTVTKKWYDILRQNSKHILIGAPSPFQHVACRTGIELARDKSQVDYWLSLINNAKNKMSVDQAYKELIDRGSFDCPYMKINKKTGEIIEVSSHG